MCEKCPDIINKYYSHLSEDDQMNLIWNATAYPFGGPEKLEKDLKELKENTDGSLEAAVDYAHKKMDEAWERAKQEGIM